MPASPGRIWGSVAWGDYDNDGDLDILLTGQYRQPIRHRPGLPQRRRRDLHADIAAGLPGVTHSSAAWGDYDNDGDLDILLTGDTGSAAIAGVYRNDGGGVFTDIGAGLPGVEQGSVAWGDYDNDGDLDILLAGTPTTALSDDGYLPTSTATTGMRPSPTSRPVCRGCEYGSAAWGDYDNDGDLDILHHRIYQRARLVAGSTVTTGTAPSPTSWPGCRGSDSSVAWGDYDNDGDLDILLTGEFDSGTFTGISQRWG